MNKFMKQNFGRGVTFKCSTSWTFKGGRVRRHLDLNRAHNSPIQKKSLIETLLTIKCTNSNPLLKPNNKTVEFTLNR